MARYLISFPGMAIAVPDGEWDAVGRDAHAVIDAAKAAGVYVLRGGIDENEPPRLSRPMAWDHDTLEMPTDIVVRKVSQP
jgi:hypothetical protein